MTSPHPIRRLVLAGLAAAAMAPAALPQCPLVELLPPDVALGDRFGETVALDGDVLWVGAPAWSATPGGVATGKVYRLSVDGTVLGGFVPPGGTEAQSFGRTLAVDGPRVLVGSPGKDIPFQQAGEAWLFEFDGSGWDSTRLTPPTPHKNAQFGTAVALRGDLAFVGAPALGSLEPGRVHVFSSVGGGWQHETALVAPPPLTTGDMFGAAMAVDGDRLVVGAPRDTDGVHTVGAAHLFSFDGSDWLLEQSIYGKDTAQDAHSFGGALALEGDVLAIGATGLLQVNTVTVYRDGPSGFALEATLNEGNPLHKFGWAVHLRGDRLMVGAPRWNSSPELEPRAYVYEYDGADWPLVATLSAAVADGDSHFGTSLDQDDERLLVGAVPLGTPDHVTGVSLFDLDLLAWAEPWDEVGPGVAGASGVPGLMVDGPLCEGGFVLLRAWALPASSQAWLVAGLSALGQPFKGGTLWPFPDVIDGPMTSSATGTLQREVPLTLPVPPGLELVLQVWAPDAAAPAGWVATPGVAGTTAP